MFQSWQDYVQVWALTYGLIFIANGDYIMKESLMVSNKKLDNPINQFQQLLAITTEECNELSQVCMKLIRKYDNLKDAKSDKYIELLKEEAGDVLCMIELLVEHNLLTNEELGRRVNEKRTKLKQWSDLINERL